MNRNSKDKESRDIEAKDSLDVKLDRMLHNMHNPDSKVFIFNAAKAGDITLKVKVLSIIERFAKNRRVLASFSGFAAVLLFFNFLFLSPIFLNYNDLNNLKGTSPANSDDLNSQSSSNDIASNESDILSNVDSSLFLHSSTGSISSSKSNTETATKGTISNTKATLATINQTKSLPKFATYQEIIDLLKTMKTSYGGSYLDGAVMPIASPNAAPTTKEGVSTTSTTSVSSDFSSTNTQVSGIEEGDIIKNDGKYLYIVKSNAVSIVNAYPADEMKTASTITLPKNEYVQEIYIKGNILTVISNSYGDSTIYPNPLAADIANTSGTTKIAATWIYNKQMTVVHVYDIASKGAPVLLRDLSFDGYLLSSREKDGKFYLVTNSYITCDTTKDLTAKDVLPSYSDSRQSAADILIPATSISFCPENISANYLMICCFDIDSTTPVAVETVLGAGNTIFMSNSALYIVQPFYRYTILPVEPQSTSTSSKTASTTPGSGNTSGFTSATVSGTGSAPATSPIIATNDEGTVIMKFSLVETGVKFTVAGEVPGQVLNQYSMDEYAGTFRIATTKWGNLGSANSLYTLNSEMNVIGKIENLAQGERIYAVRFTEKTGYIVTYRQVDPLFVIDLAIPSAPRVVGELKIPGFSNYLHPVSATLLLGIGQNTIPVTQKDANGNDVLDNDGNVVVIRTMQSGLKVSLFDVSNPQKPVELDYKLFGGPGSSSEAQYNPRSFVWWNSTSTALFPAYLQGVDGGTTYDNYTNSKSGALAVSVDAATGKLTEKARLFPENTTYANYTQTRAVYIENTIYLSMNSSLYAYNAATMKEIGRIGY